MKPDANHDPAPQPAPGDDPRLTAYALGELEGEEHAADRAAVEALLAREPAARAELERLRELAGELTLELAAEGTALGGAATLRSEQRAAIECAAAAAAAGASGGAAAGERARSPGGWRALRAMWAPALAATLLAALVWWLGGERARTRELLSPDFAGGPPAGGAEHDALERGSKLPGLGYLGAGGGATGAPAATSSTAAQAQADAATDAAASPFTYELFGTPKELLREGDLLGVGGGGLGGGPGGKIGRRDTEAATSVDSSRQAKLQALGYVGSSGGDAASSGQLSGRGRIRSVLGESKVIEADLRGLGYAGHDGEWASRYFRSWPNTEGYEPIVESGFVSPWKEPLSTFSVDVDSASYSNVRRFLNQGQLPPADAVRIEELVNTFRYAYPQPEGELPFSVTADVTGCPWAPAHRLVRIGLQGREIPQGERPPSNLVFLVDVSGSMNSPDKLPLVQASLRLLVRQLDARDRIAIVAYAGNAGLVLPSTGAGEKQVILDALDRLRAGGSTAGGAGIQLAYQVAAAGFLPGGTNRVILATDGDFNVGITARDELQALIERSAKGGVFLTVLGFGTGNLKDGTAELLADKGNGHYAYIDSLDEGRRVLVEQMGGTLVTIAKDVKIQVELNPARVQAYRLIGYENRALAAQDFNDDRKDAGEIGAGHSVTALYEIVPVGVERTPAVDPLRYQPPADEAAQRAARAAALVESPELLHVKLRYKQPDGDTSRLLERSLVDGGAGLDQADPELRFAASVALFGMLLRGSAHAGDAGWADVVALAEGARGADREGYRAELIRLVRLAASLSGVSADELERQLRQFGQLGYVGPR